MRRNDFSVVGAIIVLAVIALVIYLLVLAISALVTIAAGSGLVWGGGTALFNYFKSFKENMIESNLNHTPAPQES